MNLRLNIVILTLVITLVGAITSVEAQSTSLDHPTPITTNIISGSLDKSEKGRNYYYSVLAGPGEVNFTLTIGKATSGTFQTVVTILDANEVVIGSLVATSGAFNGGQANQIITLKRRQRITLQLGHSSFDDGGGDFRLRIGDTIELGGSTPDSAAGMLGIEPTAQPVLGSKCLPNKGTLIIKMKDGSKKIIDLGDAETVTVVP